MPFEVVVITLYWSLVYASGDDVTSQDWFDDLSKHGAAAAIVLLDLTLSRTSMPDRHAIIAFLAALGYVVWNAAYVRSTGYVLYSVLTWSSPATAAYVIGALAGIVVAFFLASAWATALDACCRSRVVKYADDPRREVLPFDTAFPARFLDDARAGPCATALDCFVCCSCCCGGSHAVIPSVNGIQLASVVPIHHGAVIPPATGMSTDFATAPAAAMRV